MYCHVTPVETTRSVETNDKQYEVRKIYRLVLVHHQPVACETKVIYLILGYMF